MSDLRRLARRAAEQLAADARPAPQRLEALGEVGLTGVPLPAALGGLDAGFAEHVAVLEELARADPALGAAVAAHVGAALVIADHGGAEQRDRLLPALAQGHETASLAVDEGRAGLDADLIATTADDAGRLTGAKRAVRGAGWARVLVTVARQAGEPAAFVLRRGPAGPRPQGADLVFDGTPAERLGPPGAGRRIALRAATDARVATAALATGVAAAALDLVPFDLPGEGDRVAAARALTARAAELKDLGLPHAVEAATAERLALGLARELADVAGEPALLASLDA